MNLLGYNFKISDFRKKIFAPWFFKTLKYLGFQNKILKSPQGGAKLDLYQK